MEDIESVEVIVIEIVELEEHAHNHGTEAPHAKHYAFRVDKQRVVVSTPTITGTQILAEVGKTPERFKLYLNLDRQYYSSTNDSWLREKISQAKIAGKQVLARPAFLLDVVRKFDLKALLVPDRKRIMIDEAQPKPKWRWNETHEIIHSVVPWHDGAMMGDTEYTLTPDCHEVSGG
jgi:hypothetical protein